MVSTSTWLPPAGAAMMTPLPRRSLPSGLALDGPAAARRGASDVSNSAMARATPRRQPAIARGAAMARAPLARRSRRCCGSIAAPGRRRFALGRAGAGGGRRCPRLCLPACLVRGVELQLDFDAVGIGQEDLVALGPGHDAGFEGNIRLLEPLGIGVHAGCGEGDMVEGGLGALRRLRVADEMHDRPIAGIEPGAGKGEGGTGAEAEAQKLLVERLRTLEITRADIHVIEAADAEHSRHGCNPPSAVGAASMLPFRMWRGKGAHPP